VSTEIQRYWNDDHDKIVNEKCSEIRSLLDRINNQAYSASESEIEELEVRWQKINDAVDDWMDCAKPIWHAIGTRLDNNAPSIVDVEWTKPFAVEEDEDPLFNSARNYVEQIDRYKKHQGKMTERKKRLKKRQYLRRASDPL
jgi:hypothetical protein